MGIPGKVKGAGNGSTARNVFKVTFSAALYEAPKLTAWDGFDINTVLKKIFTGTAGNGNIPMISGAATTDAAPPSNWKPASPVSGGAAINRLKGNENYVVLSVSGSPDAVRFNLCWDIPADVGAEEDLNSVISVEYAYSSTPPDLAWFFNDEDAGGTEGTPVWTQFSVGSSGSFLKPTDSGVSPPDLVFTLPPSGAKENPELWVDAWSLTEEWASCESAYYYSWDPQPFSFTADLGAWIGRLYGAPSPDLYVKTSPGRLTHFCAGPGDDGYVYLPNLPTLQLERTTVVKVNHKYWTVYTGDIKISFRDGDYPGWTTVWEATLGKYSDFVTEGFSVGVDLTPYVNLNFVIQNCGSRDECIDWVSFE